MSTEAPIRLLLVDDHPIVRDGLRRIEETWPALRIVAEAGTGRDAVEAARRERPDVVLMDVRLPDGDGIEACREIKEFLPRVQVLFLTSDADNRLSRRHGGRGGWLSPEESGCHRIVVAIGVFAAAAPSSTRAVARRALHPTAGSGIHPVDLLTWLEGKVLAEVASGKTDKEVAAALNLSPKTARNYVTRIFAKLNVRTRTEAALLHVRHADDSKPRGTS